jgi:mono/diheme cytochrome c family protein
MGFLLGVAGAAGAGYAWLHYGGNPSALRGKLPSMPAGPSGESPKSGDPSKTPIEPARRIPPFGTSEDVFEGGAHVYRARCASCHGTPGHDAVIGQKKLPASPQLWKSANGGGIGVSAREAGDIYAQIAHGRHKSGMPSFATTLSDTQIWQVTLLLKNADKELPDPVIDILEGK